MGLDVTFIRTLPALFQLERGFGRSSRALYMRACSSSLTRDKKIYFEYVPYCHLWPLPAIQYFPHYLINGTILYLKKMLDIKLCFDFLCNFCSIFYFILFFFFLSKKNWILWCQETRCAENLKALDEAGDQRLDPAALLPEMSSGMYRTAG